jgi:hypothetical protein
VAADGLVAVLGPAFATLDRVTAIRTPLMWGALADAIMSEVVEDALARDASVADAVAEGAALVEAIDAAVSLPRVRPVVVAVSGRHAVRRGTCCLWYRTQPSADPCGEGFCDDCPRRDPADQRQRWARIAGSSVPA